MYLALCGNTNFNFITEDTEETLKIYVFLEIKTIKKQNHNSSCLNLT